MVHLNEALSIPIDSDTVPARSDTVIELIEEKAGQRQLRCNPIGDEDAVSH